MRVAFGPPRNSYATRNMAVEASRGEILAFCDADCRPEPDWLERGVKALESTDIVAGRFRFDVPEQRTAWTLIDMDGSKDHEHQVRIGLAETANLFVRRELFDRLGGLDGSIAEYGDYEFAERAVAAGVRLSYGADAIVWHPTRDAGKPLLRALWKYNRGYAVHAGRAGVVPDAVKLREWVPIVQTLRSRRRFGRSLGPDRELDAGQRRRADPVGDAEGAPDHVSRHPLPAQHRAARRMARGPPHARPERARGPLGAAWLALVGAGLAAADRRPRLAVDIGGGAAAANRRRDVVVGGRRAGGALEVARRRR